MAVNAPGSAFPINVQRVYKRNRAYAVVFGSTAMTTLATEIGIGPINPASLVMRTGRSEKICQKRSLRYGIECSCVADPAGSLVGNSCDPPGIGGTLSVVGAAGGEQGGEQERDDYGRILIRCSTHVDSSLVCSFLN